MPEGPEIERVRDELLILENVRLREVSFTPSALTNQRYREQQDRAALIRAKVLEKLERRGKYLIWWFESLPALNHFGMTGTWSLEKSAEGPATSESSKYAKVILNFEGGNRAIFEDMRNFGRFQVYDSEEDMLARVPRLKTLGIHGLQANFPQKRFEKLLDLPVSRDKPLAEALTSSRVVSDIGNMYKSEILFVAKLNPTTTATQLSSTEKRRLGRAIRLVLKRAYENDGVTIEDVQSPSSLEQPVDVHYVYGKKGRPCPSCGEGIERFIQSQRSTYFCPKCQVPK
ncbi:MAG: hypothetical protein OXN17_21675 [Candidatus Poribacteria bacterium]|nr:hypothetical protein [Candidatus Poribacteria bacterium]MDE0506348.1 hypothetical protein [Candidatus Poribacteria bacterium]